MGSSERIFRGRTPHAGRDAWSVPFPSLRDPSWGQAPDGGSWSQDPNAGLGTAPRRGQGGWGRGSVLAAGEPLEPAIPGPSDAEIEARLREALGAGYAEGRDHAERELAAALGAVRAIERSLETAIPRDVEMVARTVAELAVLIARRIVGAELQQHPAALVAAIENGLRHAVGASVIHVELHPDALETVEAAWFERHGRAHHGFTWSFAADPTLLPGGCRLRTEHGVVEAGFEAQLSEVAAALDAAIPGYLSSAVGTPSGGAARAAAPAVAVPGAGIAAPTASSAAVFDVAAAITAQRPAVDLGVGGIVPADALGPFTASLPVEGPSPEDLAALLAGGDLP